MSDIYVKLRVEYRGRALIETDLTDDPIAHFADWFDEAVAAEIPLANAVTLATVDPDGQPSARVVLLKGFDADGFVFFTNYNSRKGRALAAHPRACLNFWWEPLARQVRIEGHAVPVDAAESDAYFASRPRESNLSAVASPQSEVVSSRAELEARVAALADVEISRPEHWGGYRLRPVTIEFWQGRPDRLHDRIRYRRVDGSWQSDRLAP